MNKENILFCALGLLLGYVVAFTFVTYQNLHPEADVKSAKKGENPSAGSPQTGGRASEEATQAAMQAAKDARENPDDYDRQMSAAQLNYEAGDYEESIGFLTRAIELRPDKYEVLVLLGDLNYDAGRFVDAERWYKEALKRDPDDLRVRTDLGLTYFKRQPPDIESALSEFRRSLEKDPRHELSLQNITVVLARKASIETNEKAERRKSLREAEQSLTKLEQVNPNNQAIPLLRDAISKARAALDPAAAGDRQG